MLRNRKRAAFSAVSSVIDQLEKRALLSAVVASDGTLTITGTNQARCHRRHIQHRTESAGDRWQAIPWI